MKSADSNRDGFAPQRAANAGQSTPLPELTFISNIKKGKEMSGNLAGNSPRSQL
jgi:hypothetical protein